MAAIIQTPDEIHNSVPLLEESPHLSSNVLQRIGATFIMLRQHENWGVCLTHRHLELKSDELMVHQLSANGTLDVCKPLTSDHIDVHPHSWHFTTNGRFEPYEYGTQERPPPPLQLRSALEAELSHMGLRSNISLIPIVGHIEGRGQKWIEYVDIQDRSMTSSLVPENTHLPGLEAVGWRFWVTEEGSMGIGIARECKRDTMGFHKAVYT
ncbi:hypothetical protein D6D18_03324 [Aureobasidium pullulans]|nr:hypothetical protein D6D18_03324 [Aureobasidium pullulans]